jgi:hypothetical protein
LQETSIGDNGTVPQEPDIKHPIGRPLAIDHSAPSASSLPGFLARPVGAPVYHGFQVLSDVMIDGFVLGAITDFEAAECDQGDAFVIAPDGSRAGLVWKVSSDWEFDEVLPATKERWGVYAVAFPHKMSSRENAKMNLAHVLSSLRPKWDQWREEYLQPSETPGLGP